MSAVTELAAAVSNAGGLGTLALTWSTPGGDPVRDTAALTDRPFGGNLIIDSDQHRRLDEALEAGLRIVSLMWGDPAGYVDQVHEAKGIVLHTVGSAEEARRVGVQRSRCHRGPGVGGGRTRVEPDRHPSPGASSRGRGGTGAGDRRRRDRGRPGRGRGVGPGRPSRVAGYPVPAGPRDAHPRGVPPPADRRPPRPMPSGTPTCTTSGGRTRPTGPSATRRPRCGRPRAGLRWGAGRERASSPSFPSGEEIRRYEPAAPLVGTTGDIEALSLWAGQSVALARQPQSSAEIVAELVSAL